MLKNENKVWRLKHARPLRLPGTPEMQLENGEEFRLVNEVLYMRGHILMAQLQQPMIKWIKDNPKLFIDDTRVF